MDDRFNTIAGWTLFAGIVALGSSLVAGEMFHSGRPEKMGYPIEGVEVEGGGGEAEKPIEFYLASADAAKGEEVFKKCAACHNADKGGAQRSSARTCGACSASRSARATASPSPTALTGKGGTWDWRR